MKQVVLNLFICMSSIVIGSDTGYVEIIGKVSTKFNETHVLTVDKYNQKIWIPREKLERLSITLESGQSFHIEISSANIVYEK